MEPLKPETFIPHSQMLQQPLAYFLCLTFKTFAGIVSANRSIKFFAYSRYPKVDA